MPSLEWNMIFKLLESSLLVFHTAYNVNSFCDADSQSKYVVSVSVLDVPQPMNSYPSRVNVFAGIANVYVPK